MIFFHACLLCFIPLIIISNPTIQAVCHEIRFQEGLGEACVADLLRARGVMVDGEAMTTLQDRIVSDESEIAPASRSWAGAAMARKHASSAIEAWTAWPPWPR